jgi:hypothetical protein
MTDETTPATPIRQQVMDRETARGIVQSRRDEEANRLAPVLTWEQFTEYVFRWRQGEHCALIGPTGSGKTTLALALLQFRKYVVALGTKPRDSTLSQLIARGGFKRMSKWERESPTMSPKRVLWPDASQMNSAVVQRNQFQNALDHIYREGGWCVYIDELWFIIHHLKLELAVKTYLQQARALQISLVVATQRPAHVPLEVYDQSTHLFFWLDNDERNLKRISGISWLSADLVRHLVSRLEHHQVLYINTRTGRMFRTKAPSPTGEVNK